MRFPSDLTLGTSEPDALCVSGRVVSVTAEELTLSDAFASVRVLGVTARDLKAGDLVTLEGNWNGSALVAHRIEVSCRAPEPRGDGDFARLVFAGVGRNLAARARAIAAMRAHFARERFIEIETPLRVPTPNADRNIDLIASEAEWLIASPELEMKRLLVGGVPRQYQFARVHRRDEAGHLHETEFTLLEWYRAFADIEAMLSDTEQLVHAAAVAVRGSAELVTADGRRLDASPPFLRVRMADAFREHAGIEDCAALAENEPDRYFRLLVENVEPALAALARPVFLTDYPISEAALARPCARDRRFAERFELYAAGIELANGYGELTDAREQRRRFLIEREQREREARPVYPLDERFLSALEAGMPPSSGNALGVDRLILLLTGARAIQDVIALPRAELGARQS